ncbi:hypothetical protein B0H11DRAFT_2375490 [Mycena galericulata]|nr:hypothetical protein B0H11DRAFT_2375490 [Mycena galericulata]
MNPIPPSFHLTGKGKNQSGRKAVLKRGERKTLSVIGKWPGKTNFPRHPGVHLKVYPWVQPEMYPRLHLIEEIDLIEHQLGRSSQIVDATKPARNPSVHVVSTGTAGQTKERAGSPKAAQERRKTTQERKKDAPSFTSVPASSISRVPDVDAAPTADEDPAADATMVAADAAVPPAPRATHPRMSSASTASDVPDLLTLAAPVKVDVRVDAEATDAVDANETNVDVEAAERVERTDRRARRDQSWNTWKAYPPPPVASQNMLLLLELEHAYQGEGLGLLYITSRVPTAILQAYQAGTINWEEFSQSLDVKVGHTECIRRRISQYRACRRGMSLVWHVGFLVEKRMLAERLVHLRLRSLGIRPHILRCSCSVCHREYYPFQDLGSFDALVCLIKAAVVATGQTYSQM